MASPFARLRRALAPYLRAPGARDEAQFHQALGVLGDLSERGRAASAAAKTRPRSEARVPLVFVDEAPTTGDGEEFARSGRRPLLPEERRWRMRVGATVVLVGLAATATAIVVISRSTPQHRLAAAGSRRHAGGSTSTTTPASTSTSTTTTTPAIAGTPTISALSPDTGAPGTTVSINGSDFVSRNGFIVATFDGRTTPTTCTGAQHCSAVVPSGLHGPVTVELRTAKGNTNGVTFTVS